MKAMSQSCTPRVALVHDWLTGMRGGEKVLEQVAGIFPEAPIYTLFHFPGSVSPALEKHPIYTSFLQSYPGLGRHYRRFLPLFPAAIEDFDLTGYDVIFSSSHCVAKGAQPRPGGFHVCYCHTPMRYAWDQEHAYFPQRTGLVARLRSLILTRLRHWDVTSASRVDLFLANSSFVAGRIKRYYGRESEILHPPVDTDFFSPDDLPTEGYCLVVSALSPYKRIDLAIAACEHLGVEVRIVGDGPEKERLSHTAGPRTRFLGWVTREDLRNLYRHARCLVQPGVEDFGIAAVEALACGCPVVAANAGGVTDIVEDGEHGVLYPASEGSAALAQAIDKLPAIGFNELNLRRRAESFSVAKFEDQLRGLLAHRLTDWVLF